MGDNPESEKEIENLDMIRVLSEITGEKIETQVLAEKYKEGLALLGYGGKVIRIPSLKSQTPKSHQAKVRKVKGIIRKILDKTYTTTDPRKLMGKYDEVYKALWMRKEAIEKGIGVRIEPEEYDEIVTQAIYEIAKRNRERLMKLKKLSRG